MKTIEFEDYTIEYDDSAETEKRVSDILLKWFLDTQMFSGETLAQSDTTYIEAPELLAEIAETGFQFKYINKEQS